MTHYRDRMWQCLKLCTMHVTFHRKPSINLLYYTQNALQLLMCMHGDGARCILWEIIIVVSVTSGHKLIANVYQIMNSGQSIYIVHACRVQNSVV